MRWTSWIAYRSGMTIRTAIFDFDELLINLQSEHFAADRAAMAAHGHDYDDLPEAIRLGGSGRRISELLAEMRAHFGIAEPVDALMLRRQEHFLIALRDAPVLPAMPGAVEAVNALYDTGFPLAVTSSGIREYIALVLDRLDIADRFRVVITGADVTHGKPHPEPYLVTAARLGVPPADCVVFEDATVGVQAAKAAGMRCIAVPNREATQPQDLSAADLILPSLTIFSPALLARWA
ncbi:MAG: HAD family hydrolase [Thermomicrobiales bacterium]